MRYKIIKAYSAEELELKVQQELDCGGWPEGGVAVSVVEGEPNRAIWAQALSFDWKPKEN